MVRADFPYFSHHPKDVYLDSAATTHKPSVVIEAVRACYENYAPIHRGLYRSSVELSDQYEQVRSVAAAFIGAVPEEIIFTKNATEGLNLLAHSLPLAGSWNEGDEVILSVADHHAVILPWQEAAKRHGLALRFLELDEQGAIDLESLPTILSDRTRAIAITHVSNTLGSITDLPRLRQILTMQGSEAVVIADACQSAPHFPISVGSLGADFLVFSGHKLYAPAGTGVLWGRESMLSSLPPLLTGGDMVVQVGRLESAFLPPPQRFEAGTPATEGVIGLGAALRYLTRIGMDAVRQHTHDLALAFCDQLRPVPGLSILASPHPDSGIISFSMQGVHAHNVAQFLGDRSICVRAGQQCAALAHGAMGVPASVRVSLGIYSMPEDIAPLVTGLTDLYHLFHG